MRFPFLAALFCAVLSIPASANVLRMDLKAALDNHLISVSATGSGQSYRAKGLNLKIVNKSGSSLILKTDLGLIFRPADTTYQDLVLAGEEMITVAPFKEATAPVQTFCAKSQAAAPAKDLVFSFHKAGDHKLVQVLQYIKRSFLFDDLGQSAVWVLTSGHDLSTVYESNREQASLKLIDQLAAITGLPKPDYYRQYKLDPTATGPVFQPKNLKIIARFEHKLEAPVKLTLGVYNEAGDMIQPVFENRTFGKAIHRFGVEFEATNAAPGTYYIRLKEGTTVLQEKSVRVD